MKTKIKLHYHKEGNKIVELSYDPRLFTKQIVTYKDRFFSEIFEVRKVDEDNKTYHLSNSGVCQKRPIPTLTKKQLIYH